MTRIRLLVLLIGALAPLGASAQIPVPAPPVPPPPPAEAAPPAEESGAPIPAGSMEVQLGIAGLVLPEASGGMLGAQPEVRLGYFLHERLELQAELSTRVWPLGTIAADSYGVSGNVLVYPGPPAARARLFLLAGAGGAFADPPGLAEGRSFDPLVRGGIGVRIPLAGLGVPILDPLTFITEYRGELVFPDDSDFVSGVSLAVARFL